MKSKHLLMNEVGDGGDGGGAPDGGGDASLLGSQAQPGDFIPEKYRVADESGGFNLEASARKLAESYGHLEKRIGTGDLPPKSVEEYSLDGGLPDGFDAADVMQDPVTQGFLKRCHAKGMTNAQVQDVLSFALEEWAPKLLDGHEELSINEAVSAMRETWKTDQEFNSNMQSAYKAFHAFADQADVQAINSIGNNPVVLRLLANIGREMSEDIPANLGGDGLGGGDTLESLMASEAYNNPTHPDHARVSQKVSAAYQKKYGTASVL